MKATVRYVTLGGSVPVLPLFAEDAGVGGGELPGRSSFLSAKSRRPRFEWRVRSSALERDEVSHSLELDDGEEDRGRPCDFAVSEMPPLVDGRDLDGGDLSMG